MIQGEHLIKENDVILTYGGSTTIENILTKAHLNGKNFKAIIAEGRPDRMARSMVERLSKIGINITYVLTQSVLYLIRDVKKVKIIF